MALLLDRTHQAPAAPCLAHASATLHLPLASATLHAAFPATQQTMATTSRLEAAALAVCNAVVATKGEGALNVTTAQRHRTYFLLNNKAVNSPHPQGLQGSHLNLSQTSAQRHGTKKERKKTDNPREGWENGTPPPHRDFKERCVVR